MRPHWVGFLAIAGIALAGESLRSAAEEPVAGIVLNSKPLMFRRAAKEKAWQLVQDKEAVHPGELLLGGGGPVIVSSNKAVQTALIGDMSATSPFPIIETAVVLHPAGEFDMDLTLDRGAITLTNCKEKGSAHVHVRLGAGAGELVLKEPGDKVAVEVFGRWPPGTHFHKDARSDTGPVLGLAVLAIKGEAELRGKTKQFMMKAPPGPALLVASDLAEEIAAPRHLDQLPDWVDGKESAREKGVKAILAKFHDQVASGSLSDALDGFVKSEDARERKFAILLMGGLDDLPRIRDTLLSTKHEDVWSDAIVALRHWLGRGPGQDQKLYASLIEQGKYKPREAEIFVELLHGFSAAELARPAAYEALLDYLESDRPGLRALAIWHLVRLVPEGAKIGFNPLGPKEDRERCCKEWAKLLPAGKVPEAVKKPN
jgi:hypothetical protein